MGMSLCAHGWRAFGSGDSGKHVDCVADQQRAARSRSQLIRRTVTVIHRKNIFKLFLLVSMLISNKAWATSFAANAECITAYKLYGKAQGLEKVIGAGTKDKEYYYNDLRSFYVEGSIDRECVGCNLIIGKNKYPLKEPVAYIILDKTPSLCLSPGCRNYIFFFQGDDTLEMRVQSDVIRKTDFVTYIGAPKNDDNSRDFQTCVDFVRENRNK